VLSTHLPAARFAARAACGVAIAVACFLTGCSSSGSASTASTTAGAGSNSSRAELASAKGGAQLWTENCSRCHNLRPPDYYSPGRWAIVGQHMRVRGYLTGEEERQVTAFLQSQ
jgi:cytochrome c2